ncbi:M4 family metallopeptidase [Fluoribacter gormanii]|uniref:M4 family metallopeptidase n=1 Tax=Fluoribacter gormanii TaxID=464 RepID=UPI00104149D7|nr:M4 family metallopeptidase [Fluoribacter gormanii]
MGARKLPRLLQGFTLVIYLSPLATYAAQQELIWGKEEDHTSLLKNFSLEHTAPISPDLQLPTNLSFQKNTINTLRFVSGDVDTSQVSHIRYNQYYDGLPVFGAQVIYHISSKANTTVTGLLIDDIDQDIPNLDGKITIGQAEAIATAGNSVATRINTRKIIYFDKNHSSKAILAYHISYVKKTSRGPSISSYIIDANKGTVLQEWDALPKSEIGQGPGGVTFNNLPYRSGRYQFGNLEAGTNALGKFDILFQNNACSISNNLFRVINLKNQEVAQLPFDLPISTASEIAYQLIPFVYACSSPNYANLTDNGFAPVNDGLSPINDVTYFVKQTFSMLTSQYKVPSPIGTQLPLRVYTHLADFDNAFACGPHCMQEGGIVGPQQLVFGNGKTRFAPLTEADVVSHELGHLVTDHFSTLIYSQQSGGINEAFSDITGMTFNNYLRTALGFTWYWNGNDWTIGANISKTGKPLRYMNNPPLDGRSIDNAANFIPGMNVHYSSGVFNKAFYLLSTTPGWTISKAYRIILDANMHYWIPGTDFAYGACGVIQAAYNRGYPYQDVIIAFSRVGVTCLVGQSAIMATNN